MLGRADSGMPIGIEDVDVEFWALILEDAEWLQAEFGEIVSEPDEAPVLPADGPGIDGAQSGEPRRTPAAAGPGRPWRAGRQPGRQWRRERSPPLRQQTTIG
jgi:hypothetical protein